MDRNTHGPSFLRWAGSKRRIIPRLRELVRHQNETYIEPFCGSASLFFATAPRSSFLSDLNGCLIGVFRWMRDRPKTLHSKFAELPISKDDYYRIRQEYNDAFISGIDRAARFLYLNRYCFNGLWRTNQAGQFNVPYGGIAAGAPSAALFIQCGAALSSSVITECDFREALAPHPGRGCFVFADPPYFTEGARTFREYGPRTFGWNDLIDLRGHLTRMRSNGASIALVYSDGEEVRQLFKGWNLSSVAVTRNIGGFASRRKIDAEVLITSFEPPWPLLQIS